MGHRDSDSLTLCTTKSPDTVEANERLGLAVDSREYGAVRGSAFRSGSVSGQGDLKQPGKLRAPEKAGLEIGERVSIEETPRNPRRGIFRRRKRNLGTCSIWIHTNVRSLGISGQKYSALYQHRQKCGG